MEKNDNNNNSKKNNIENKTKYENYINQVDPLLLQKWKQIQNSLKDKLIEIDSHDWTIDSSKSTDIKRIGGMDISVSKIDPTKGVSALVIIDENLNKIYEDFQFIEICEPYIPGFLAFREVSHLVKLIENIKNNNPELIPQVLLIDGNGIYHVNKFGLACHIGVLVDIPTIGCSKSVFLVDGIDKYIVRNISNKFTHNGEYSYLVGKSGITLGAVMKTSTGQNPIIISIGHKVSLDTSIKIIKKVNKFRVPESIRLADKISRIILHEYEKNNFNKFDIKLWLNKQMDNINKL